tara:strand:- start:19836 stop:20135 length:300 start_codon:yes stop_codon:yes gene_type:complete
MANINLKSLVKESALGNLPSSKLFKYNKATGKYDSPGSVTEESVNEAPAPGMAMEIQEDLDDAYILVWELSKKVKSYSPKAFSKIRDVLKVLAQVKKDI